MVSTQSLVREGPQEQRTQAAHLASAPGLRATSSFLRVRDAVAPHGPFCLWLRLSTARSCNPQQMSTTPGSG